MNISTALEGAANILKTLKALPKHTRCPPIIDRYPRLVINEAHAETLRRCLPFFSRIMKEVKSYHQTFDEGKLEKAVERMSYVETKLEDARQDLQEQAKKNGLIAEIEKLEKTNVKKFQKTVIDEEKSMKIIEYLFESCEDSAGMKVLERLVDLTFDRAASDKTDAYEKILHMLQ